MFLSVAPIGAQADPCGAAIERAAARTGVPAELLYAMATVESGLHLPGRQIAWPWAINDGRSLLFRTRAAALAHVRRLLEDGKRNVDIGCMQINWRWHGDAFGSPAELIDPQRNVLYAARYLVELRHEFGTWSGAVSAYHSRNADRAAAYRCRVAAALRPGVDIADCE